MHIPAEPAEEVAGDRKMPSTLSKAIHARHSIRDFLPTPVPRKLFQEALQLASQAPSNSNTQVHRVYMAEGATADALKAALVQIADGDTAPAIPPLPEPFRHYRNALAKQLYSDALLIPREDTASRKIAVLRNFAFFDAPLVGVIAMHQDLSEMDALSVGMWLQTLLLALTERGLGTICLGSVTGYPQKLREHLAIPDDERILVGLAVGYTDDSKPINHVHNVIDPIESKVFFR